MAKTEKPKKVSMKKVAKTYRKSRTAPAKTEWSGARLFDQHGQDYAAGTTTKGKNKYKPAAKSVTLGGTRKSKPTTIRKTGRV